MTPENDENLLTLKKPDKLTGKDGEILCQDFRDDYTRFYTECLGMPVEHVWAGMHQISDSVRDYQKTCVYSGHSLSKDYGCARLALAFLYSHGPKCTVIVTGPSNNQVENIFMREVRDAYNGSVVPMGGRALTSKLEISDKWFMLGFTTDADTTGEATRFQGFHNEEVLVIFTEAAGIPHMIWKAAKHLIISPKHRMLVYGNATSATGDFAECNEDPDWNKITLSVLESPNYKAGYEMIPGISGREYEAQIARDYGQDSDEYAVRVLGHISRKALQGSYYGPEMVVLKRTNIGHYPHESGSRVFTFWDLGTTYTSIGFYQFKGDGIYCIDEYLDDCGQGLEQFARILADKQYNYAEHWTGWDNDPSRGSNKMNGFTGETVFEAAKRLGITFKFVSPHAFADRIRTTKRFLKDKKVFFNQETTLDTVSGLNEYRRRQNMQQSTEDRPVFHDEPVKDGMSPHIADQFGHMVMTYYTQKLYGRKMGQTIQKKPIGNLPKSPYRKNKLTRGRRLVKV